jgi:hypothetical protein
MLLHDEDDARVPALAGRRGLRFGARLLFVGEKVG